jgi:hypothetical protein
MKDVEIKYIKELIQSANINFLIGSGLSKPYLKTLGNIEKHITDIYELRKIEPVLKKYVIASLFNLYFNDVMYNNKCIITDCKAADKILTSKNYVDFITIFNCLLQRRGSTILNKQINLFTTNIDLFFEKTLEDLSLEFNDGFSGRINPAFSLSNFNKVISKRSLHFDNESRIPIFNLLKIHGSLNWKFASDNKITYSTDLKVLDELKVLSDELDFTKIEDTATIDDIIKNAEIKLKSGKIIETTIDKFNKLYETIPIVNPTKAKFKETVLDMNYYELLRFYSNELEKENSILFVLGFSMADEHIAEITLRLAKSNPTLTILIFAFNEDAKKDIFKNLKNTSLENLKIFAPVDDKISYNFETINKLVFSPILAKILKNE